jgi:L-proline amide hydrolase
MAAAKPPPSMALWAGEADAIETLGTRPVSDRLHRIDLPVLLISGRYGGATPKVEQPVANDIKDVRWTIFEQSSHMLHVEEREACMGPVASFLEELEA